MTRATVHPRVPAITPAPSRLRAAHHRVIPRSADRPGANRPRADQAPADRLRADRPRVAGGRPSAEIPSVRERAALRLRLVARVRRAIQEGTYESPQKIDACADRLLMVLLGN